MLLASLTPSIVTIATHVIGWGEGGGVSGPRRRISNAGAGQQPPTPHREYLLSTYLQFLAVIQLRLPPTVRTEQQYCTSHRQPLLGSHKTMRS